MFSFSDSITQISLIVSVVSLLIALVATIITFRLSAKMKKFQSAYTSLQTFISGTKLEDLLKANLKEVRELSYTSTDHGNRLANVENKLRAGVDRAELIRFNSFENLGAELSFALALLNQEGTGVVLTGIHSIEESRIYAKAIEKGQSGVKLSPEEKAAIEKALKSIKI